MQVIIDGLIISIVYELVQIEVIENKFDEGIHDATVITFKNSGISSLVENMLSSLTKIP